MSDVPDQADQPHLLCHRCGLELTPGEGNFYLVSILAVADPWPPTITADDLNADLAALIRQSVQDLENCSEQELLDQVYRRLTIHLCRTCYEQWIENPAR